MGRKIEIYIYLKKDIYIYLLESKKYCDLEFWGKGNDILGLDEIGVYKKVILNLSGE